jgi:ADP-ribose pyrophosphatase YjhB (NUDIX family)
MEYSFCPKCGAALERRSVKAGEPDRLVCRGCSFIFYLDPKVAVGTIISTGEGVVLLKRGIEPAYGKWVFPGGLVDRGERVEDAAIRETREEACLDVRLTGLLNVYSYAESSVIIIVYTAEVIGGRLMAGDETLEARCYQAAAIPWPELAFPSTAEALRDFLKAK